MSKKVLILSSSPRRNGNSDLLCNEFMRGAAEAGHQVEKIFLKDKHINYCTGCSVCSMYGKPCPQKDDAAEVVEKMIAADVIVMATPVYFYTMSAQMKTLIDRFCAFNSSIQRKHMKAALLAVAWNDDEWTFEALVSHYKTLVRYLNLMDMGMVLGAECGTPAMTQRSEFPKLAYELGRTLS